MRHVRWGRAHFYGGQTRLAHTMPVLGQHPKAVVTPWGQGNALVDAVPGQLTTSHLPVARVERRVVLDDEL